MTPRLLIGKTRKTGLVGGAWNEYRMTVAHSRERTNSWFLLTDSEVQQGDLG